jgi:D-serine dehydratase
MQLQLGEIEEYIKAKGYSDHIANKVGMIELYDDKLTLTDIALENLFNNTGINKDTTLNDVIDIGIVAKHLLKKKEGDISICKQDCKQGKPVDNIQVNQVNLINNIQTDQVGKPVDNIQVNQVNLPNNCFIGFKVNQVVFDKIKYQSEQSGIPISTIMRDVAKHNF